MEGGSRGGASWGGPAPRSAEKGRARGSTSRPDSYEPAYIHIVRVVSERIARGEYTVGVAFHRLHTGGRLLQAQGGVTDGLHAPVEFRQQFGVRIAHQPFTFLRSLNRLAFSA